MRTTPRKSLREHFAETRGVAPVWFNADGETAAAQLRKFIGLQEFLTDRARGKRVGLCLETNLALGVALLVLDGTAEALLPVPGDLPEELEEQFFHDAGIDFVLGREQGERGGVAAASFSVSMREIEEATGDDAGVAGALLAEVDTRWVIPTSGTTGTPKLVSHSLASLTRTTKMDKAAGAGVRWGLVYDLTRFAGLQVFLQAVCGGSGIIFCNGEESLKEQVALLARHGCNAMSATPTLWRKILMTRGGKELPLRTISMGGEVADEHVLKALAATFPDARIRHIYASTEAGVGFAIDDGRAGIPARLMEDSPAGMELRVSGEGMLMVRPAAGADQHYVKRAEEIRDDSGWVETGDLVELRGDRYYFLGRANGAINVGGNKVFPQEVEDCILEVEGISMAVALARSNPIAGNLVEAFVVPETSWAGEEKELAGRVRSHCRERLEPFKVPAIVHVVDDLETSAAGKLTR